MDYSVMSYPLVCTYYYYILFKLSRSLVKDYIPLAQTFLFLDIEMSLSEAGYHVKRLPRLSTAMLLECEFFSE